MTSAPFKTQKAEEVAVSAVSSNEIARIINAAIKVAYREENKESKLPLPYLGNTYSYRGTHATISYGETIHRGITKLQVTDSSGKEVLHVSIKAKKARIIAYVIGSRAWDSSPKWTGEIFREAAKLERKGLRLRETPETAEAHPESDEKQALAFARRD